MENLVEFIVDGLNTDGGHHKQWYLEKILERLIGADEADDLRYKYDWEKGIES